MVTDFLSGAHFTNTQKGGKNSLCYAYFENFREIIVFPYEFTVFLEIYYVFSLGVCRFPVVSNDQPFCENVNLACVVSNNSPMRVCKHILSVHASTGCHIAECIVAIS